MAFPQFFAPRKSKKIVMNSSSYHGDCGFARHLLPLLLCTWSPQNVYDDNEEHDEDERRCDDSYIYQRHQDQARGEAEDCHKDPPLNVSPAYCAPQNQQRTRHHFRSTKKVPSIQNDASQQKLPVYFDSFVRVSSYRRSGSGSIVYSTAVTSSSTTSPPTYWCKDERFCQCIPHTDNDFILLEGLVLFQDNDSSSRPAYLCIKDSSPELYLVDTDSMTTMTWRPPCAAADLTVRTEGHGIVLKNGLSTLAMLVPASDDGNSNEHQIHDETAQHHAALHLCFVLDTWRMQQQEQELMHSYPSLCKSWDEGEVSVFEQERRLKLSDEWMQAQSRTTTFHRGGKSL